MNKTHRWGRPTARRASRLALAIGLAVQLAGVLPAGAQTVARGGGSAGPTGFPVRPQAPAGAPNVLVIMTDDVGFAASSTFGGPVPTPAFDALASHGLKFNRFNTNAVCSATRAALLTGRNPHDVGYGSIAETAIGRPGYNSVIPKSAATMGDVFRANGYSTAWFGKDHNTPMWELTPIGPYDHWPTGMGFDRFYGFIAGKTNQWRPDLYLDTTAVSPPDRPGYNLDSDLADKTIEWIRVQHYLYDKKPFFVYYAPASTHAPHYAPQDWIDRFRDRFDQGWDAMREESFARQKDQGVIPRDAALTPRPAVIPAWNSLSADERRLDSRFMEVYAANLAYADDQIGRVIQALKDSGQFENTIVVYIQGDNGASGEGGLKGTIGRSALNGMSSDIQAMLENIDRIGGPTTASNYPAGWAWAMDTPFQWMKTIASHLGGFRNGMVVSWPERIHSAGMRTDFVTAMDVSPTLYDLAGIKPPATVGGVQQMPLAGRSFASAVLGKRANVDDRTLYFEVIGNRSLYKNGWLLSSAPEKMPWEPNGATSPDNFKYELYDLNTDYSQSKNLAAAMPARVAEMEKLFLAEAKAHNVLPLNGNPMMAAAISNRPYVVNDRSSVTLYPSDLRYDHGAFPFLRAAHWTIEAKVTLSDPDTTGTIATDGGLFGGWTLLFHAGKPTFAWRTTSNERDVVRIDGVMPLSAGDHSVLVSFDAGDAGKGNWGTASLLVDGRKIGSTVLKSPIPLWQSGEGAMIGQDEGTGVLPEYYPPFLFSARVKTVTITQSGK